MEVWRKTRRRVKLSTLATLATFRSDRRTSPALKLCLSRDTNCSAGCGHVSQRRQASRNAAPSELLAGGSLYDLQRRPRFTRSQLLLSLSLSLSLSLFRSRVFRVFEFTGGPWTSASSPARPKNDRVSRQYDTVSHTYTRININIQRTSFARNTKNKNWHFTNFTFFFFLSSYERFCL